MSASGCVVDCSLTLVELGALVRRVRLGSAMIEEERSQRLRFCGLEGFMGEGLIESDCVGHGGAVENQARHLPRVDRLRNCQHCAG